MTLATEQAGLMFTAWLEPCLESCLSCLWSREDHESGGHRQAINRGVEREMKVCHSQPHLVPPMKLVFYDSLPSPGPTSSLLPSWIGEGRNLASRASSRASLLVRRKAPKRPTISAPTNFRRVEPPPSRLGSFRPLELSIYTPGNRLSDLPEFDNFTLEQPSPPPKAVTPQFDTRARRCQSAPFHVPRKPVGSGSRRSSLATFEQMTERERLAENPLIPHFSTLVTTGSVNRSQTRMRPLSEPLEIVQESISRDKPLPSAPDKERVWSTAASPTSPSSERQSLDHFRAGKRRFVPGSPSSPSSFNSSPQKRATYSRSRTMSDSTVSSTVTSITGGHRTSPSLSSAVTAATTLQVSVSEAQAYKEIESSLSIPLSPKYKDSFPRVYEEEKGEQEEQQRGYEYDRFPDRSVGLAF
ncbi:hypothetical protein VTN77DRAFT_8695 [Rasamsonia byssochlamydoides]|uniref:uncharacterized protein n=1 Tax=Rasamsonia byssochlamydoides TaxID=89139 RepID=UPI00374386BE